MRQATVNEFNEALAAAHWPQPERYIGKRYYDAHYSDCGTEVATKHQDISRGWVIAETYTVNPAYLKMRL